MERKIFLEENRSKFANNVESNINVDLSTKIRMLPNDNIDEDFSLYEQYNKERDECTKYRLIFAINPLCSNVLFNMKSEIVVNEGSDDCKVLWDDGGTGTSSKDAFKRSEMCKNAVNTTENITYRQAIMDTEYSHLENGKLVYHCGVDIFNNHMLRNNGFVHVNKLRDDNVNICGPVYNTIKDYLRDSRGRIVKQDLAVKYDSSKKSTDMHLYQYDTIDSIYEAFSTQCEEKDGWWGYTNPGNMKIPTNSGSSIMVNQLMANNKPCEFIDLYPDRELYSFIPKYNKYRKRVEKNWDYCVTYPYAKDTEMLDTICGGESQAIKVNTKIRTNSSSIMLLECSSLFKHNMKVGDYVSFYYYLPSLHKEKVMKTTFQKYQTKVKIVSLGDANGDSQDKIFNVRYTDIQGIYKYFEKYGCFYKKNSGGVDCSYYFRLFKKIKNIDGNELNSDVNKAAFGNNIYGDNIAQIIFTDDVDVNGLVDENGRPLSEIYLTVVKRNKGNKLWYDKHVVNTEDIEFSHCFGKLTSGLDFSGIENEPFDYNVHYFTNLNKFADKDNTELSTEYKSKKTIQNTFSAWGDTLINHPMAKYIEDDITIDNDVFYGDVVEFDNATYEKTTIGYVYHRFNTVQRESFNNEFRNLYHDEITSDDYDNVNGWGKNFEVSTYYLNDVKTSTYKVPTMGSVNSDELMFGNIMPEGYYYNPHTRIPIREEDDDYTESQAKYINYTNPRLTKEYSIVDEKTKKFHSIRVQIDVPSDYGFKKGDYIAFFNKETSAIDWGEIIIASGYQLTLRFDNTALGATSEGLVNSKVIDPNSLDRKYYAFWSPDAIPLYAKFSMSKQKFIWRPLVAPSEMIQDDELYDTPFSNGRFYIEKNVNFFLRRQDPYGKYGLSIPLFRETEQLVSNPMQRFVINGKPIDLSGILNDMNNMLDTCY